MLSTIYKKEQVTKLQKKFRAALIRQANPSLIGCKIVYRPWSERVRVHWLPDVSLWYYSKPVKNRYWNAFGIGKPKPGGRLRIACEINFPFSGVRRGTGGVFLQVSQNDIFLGHRGRIGGGSKGVTKEVFTSWFRDQMEDVADGTVTSRVALIGKLGAPDFLKQIGAFVHRCAELKSKKSLSEEPKSPLSKWVSFAPEFSGRKEYNIAKRISAKCNHGIIVNELAEQLKKRRIAPGKTRYQDLLIAERNGTPTVFFEVKTDTATSSVYAAIGQLLYHSAQIRSKPKLVAVFPGVFRLNARQRLRAIGIEFLPYRWKNDRVIFEGLDDLLTQRRNATA